MHVKALRPYRFSHLPKVTMLIKPRHLDLFQALLDSEAFIFCTVLGA